MIFHRAEQTKAVLCCCVNTFVTSAVVVDGLLYIQMRCHCNEVVSQSGPKPVFRSIRRRWAGHWDNWSQLFGRRRLCQILLHLFKSASSRPGSLFCPGTKQLWEVKLTSYFKLYLNMLVNRFVYRKSCPWLAGRIIIFHR